MALTPRIRLGQIASASLIFVATAARVAPGTGVAAGIAIQTSHCDPYLPVSKDAAFGYRARGDRCEGVYIQPVSSTPLVVASFGRFPRPDSYQPTGSVLIEWTPDTGEVRLRTLSLKPRMYYRMDSRQRAGTASFAWHTDVLAALRLTGSDIGLVALTRRTLGGAARDVYLPVRIGAPASGERDTYELLAIPGSELSEVFVGLSSVSADGAKRHVLRKPKALGRRFYPAGRPVSIGVDSLPSAGTYILEIGATLRGGGAISHEVWFDHAPPKAKPGGQ